MERTAVSPARFEIRRASLTSPGVPELILALNRELDARYPEQGANHFRLDAAEIEGDRGALLVAYMRGGAHGETPIGCGALRCLDADTAEIKRMYVTDRARGVGLGRALLAALEAEALRLGRRRLVLETGERQHEAVSLYRRAGFTDAAPWGEYIDSPLSLCMEKLVAIDS